VPAADVPTATAPSATANPTSWVGTSDSPRTIQPSVAPVIGAARPSSGGAEAGRRRMPLNHRTKASAVATTLR